MKPYNEWFRPPKRKPICASEDTERWLWIAEPERDQGIWGVGYEVSRSLIKEHGEALLERVHDRAYQVLMERVGNPDLKQGEGEDFDPFWWTPTLHRKEDGTVEIR